MRLKRIINDNTITVLSDTYNYIFDRNTGYFMRWGNKIYTSPFMSPIGPEILDIEISTVCSYGCSFCYKNNNKNGKNMSLITFDSIIDKMNPYNNIMQVALGIGDLTANEYLIPIMNCCISKNIVPNITINGTQLDEKYHFNTYAEWLPKLCGTICVSHYNDDICFNAVQKLIDNGAKNVNIHQILSNETYNECFELLKKYKDKSDSRLNSANAIVFLTLKPKGNTNILTSIKDNDKYKELINFALDNEIPIGFDSCGAKRFLKVIKGTKYEEMSPYVEPCEICRFSSYVNVDGEYFPCSFVEGLPGWEHGINVLDIQNEDGFIKKIWFNDRLSKIRHNMINNNERNCLFYNI